MPVGSRSF